MVFGRMMVWAIIQRAGYHQTMVQKVIDNHFSDVLMELTNDSWIQTGSVKAEDEIL